MKVWTWPPQWINGLIAKPLKKRRAGCPEPIHVRCYYVYGSHPAWSRLAVERGLDHEEFSHIFSGHHAQEFAIT